MALAVFLAAAVIGLVSAIFAIAHRNPVINVLSLVVTFFCVAVNYALLGAEFLAAAQILVYAGAILVLFLFVVMLLNAPEVPSTEEKRPIQRNVGLLLALATAGGAVALLLGLQLTLPTNVPAGNAKVIGKLLVGPYLFSFELVSVLLLAALVGAMFLVKRKQ